MLSRGDTYTQGASRKHAAAAKPETKTDSLHSRHYIWLNKGLPQRVTLGARLQQFAEGQGHAGREGVGVVTSLQEEHQTALTQLVGQGDNNLGHSGKPCSVSPMHPFGRQIRCVCVFACALT